MSERRFANRYICKHCGVRIIPANMHSQKVCKSCYNGRIKNYLKDRRWLNGGEDNHLLGEKLNIGLRSTNGILKVKIYE